MTPERIIKNVFFQARKMDVYEQNPDLVEDLVAAVQAENEACAMTALEQRGPERNTPWNLTCDTVAQAIRARTTTEGEGIRRAPGG